MSRAARKRTRLVKLLLGVLSASVIPVSLVAEWGPSHDMKQAWALRDKRTPTMRPA